MRKILILCLFFCSVFSSNLLAQNYSTKTSEIGLQFGVANYLGDLSKNGNTAFFGEIQAKAFRPAFGIFYRSNFHKFLSFRTGLNIAQLYGNDKFAEVGTSNYERNLHFRSNIVDVQMMMEWNILPYQIGHKRMNFTPFIGVGVGGFYFNPKAKLNGEWVNLQALGTEGQGLLEYPDRTKYSKFAFNIPAAIGFKLNLGRQFAIGAELQYKLTFTDYIDDVSTVYPDFSYYPNNYIQAVSDEAIALSYRGNETDVNNVIEEQRGDSSDNDSYFFVMINFSYKLGGLTSYKCTTNRR